jgi:hypothetical protein
MNYTKVLPTSLNNIFKSLKRWMPKTLSNRCYLISLVLVASVFVVGYSVINWLDSQYGYLKTLGIYFPVKQIILLQYACALCAISIVISMMIMHQLKKYISNNVVTTQFIIIIVLISSIHYMSLSSPDDPIINKSNILRSDSLLGWRYEPLSSMRIKSRDSDHGHMVSIDENGLRSQISSSGLQILFLGNSVTFAQTVNSDSTFSANVGGINGGVDGYCTHQERDFLINYLSDIYFDLLILVVTPVDIVTKEESEKNIKNTLAGGMVDRNSLISRIKGAIKSEISRSYIYDMLNIQLLDNESWKDTYYLSLTTREYSESKWQDWTQAIKDISKHCQVRDRPFLVVQSPARSVVKKYSQSPQIFQLNKQVSEICKENGIEYLDILPRLSIYDSQDLFFDYIHYSEYGHKIVAKIIKDYLQLR